MLSEAPSESEILDMIQEEIDQILDDNDLPRRRVSAEHRLGTDLPLKSLDLARLVASLEVRTGADPFQELVSITSVRTIGDLQEAYRRFFAGEAGGASDELLDAQRRATARRDGRGTNA